MTAGPCGRASTRVSGNVVRLSRALGLTLLGLERTALAAWVHQ
jgi:hypothetical protein